MEQFLLQYLANSIWQAPLLAAGAWFTLRTVRPSPLLQHRTWVGALALMIAMPLLTLRAGTSTPPAPGLAPSTMSVEAAIPVSIPATPTISHIDIPSLPTDPEPAAAPSPSSLGGSKEPSPWLVPRELELGPSATHWLIGLYLAMTAFMAIRLLSSWWLALRIIAQATPARLSGPASAFLNQCCERLGVDRPNVLVSAKTSSPMLVGFLQPSLLLPENFAAQLDDPAAMPNRELEAVWLHELAHLRRRDYLANFACRVAALPIAYHPVTFAVQQRIRRTREMVCDSIAATEMESPLSYARCLVSLARNMYGTIARIEGIGILDGGILEERIMQLINRKSSVNTRMQITRLATGAAMMLMVLAASAMFHLTPTLAQTAIPALPESVTAPTTPKATTTPTQAPDALQPTAPATPAAPAQPASLPAESIPSAQRTPISPELREQLADAQTELDEAAGTYENLARRQQELANVKAAVTLDGAAALDLNQELAKAKTLLDHDAQVYDSLLPQQDSALMRRQLQIQTLAESHRQIAQATLDSPELKEKMDKLNQQLLEAQVNSAEFKAQMEKLNSPELKKQLADAQAKFNNPEFKEKMQKLNQQLVQAQINSAEFKAQMEKLNSPEFKKQLADAQAKINTPEFREKMENLSKQLADAQAKFTANPEMRMRSDALDGEFDRQMDWVRSLIDEALRVWDATETAPPAPSK